MKQHGIVKFELGRRANCSSYNYVGVPIVTTGVYLVFFLVAILFEALTAKKMKNERTAVGVWVGANLIAIIALTVWAVSTGMMGYGSAICILPIVAIPLVLMIVGIPLVRRFFQAGRPLPPQPPGDWDYQPSPNTEQPASTAAVEPQGGESEATPTQ